MNIDVVYRCRDCEVNEIRDILTSVGSQIGSVHFRKRTDGSLRKMCYRLHVQNPKHASHPSRSSHSSELPRDSHGRFVSKKTSIRRPDRKVVDRKNDQLTVFDVNKVIGRDENGKQKRGAWRCVPLENVERIRVNGITYIIEEHPTR
jgi:hypothetical protein